MTWELRKIGSSGRLCLLLVLAVLCNGVLFALHATGDSGGYTVSALRQAMVQEDLPAGTYPNNIDYDVTCVAVKAVLVASEDLSEDFVYELLTQMFENQESMAATQAKFQFLTLENAVAGVGDVPMHPGAEKFYTEKGVL